MARIYFNTKTLDDALLKPYVTPNIIQESSKYVESVALSFGVPASSIAEPTPFMISQLALFWAYMTTAWRKAQFSGGSKNVEVINDSFAMKYRLFRELLDDLVSQLTADSFTNGLKAKKRTFPTTMSMSRN